MPQIRMSINICLIVDVSGRVSLVRAYQIRAYAHAHAHIHTGTQMHETGAYGSTAMHARCSWMRGA